MKKRNLIKTGVLAGTLLLGTGYAVINNRTLTFTGTGTIKAEEIDVVVLQGSNYTITNEGKGAAFVLGELTTGTKKELDIIIKNNESLYDANITGNIVITANDKTLVEGTDYTSKIDGDWPDGLSAPLEKGMSGRLTVSITPLEPMKKYSTFNVTITVVATPVL